MSTGQTEDELYPAQGEGVRVYTEIFPCKNCEHPTRPPRVRADEPGMQGTTSYGGRGLCSGCYRAWGKSNGGKRKQYNLPAKPAKDVLQDYTAHTLQTFLQRRRARLQAGSTAVAPTKHGARLQRAQPVHQRRVA